MGKLTITQASAVNVLLRFVLGDGDAPRFADDRVQEAAVTLAEDAYSALHAGLLPGYVDRAFDTMTISVKRHRAAENYA